MKEFEKAQKNLKKRYANIIYIRINNTCLFTSH